MTSLPNQLNELKDGYQEMVEKEYILNHIDFPKQAEAMEKQLISFVESLEKAEIEEVEKGIEECKENIAVLYELFEQEVMSRQYIMKHREDVTEETAVMKYENDKLMLELSAIRNSYHISDTEVKVHRQLEKQIETITKQCQQLQMKIEQHDVAYSFLGEQLKEIEQQLAKVKKEQEGFAIKLQDLRKDELDAREKIKELRHKLLQAGKYLARSNAPGVPKEYAAALSEAQKALNDVHAKLEEKPLDMATVQIFLKKAIEVVNDFTQMTRDLIEQMLLAEKVIQYTNRYRSRYASVESTLQEAESKFRQYEYGEALNQAAAVLEKIEPGRAREMHVELDFLDEEEK